MIRKPTIFMIDDNVYAIGTFVKITYITLLMKLFTWDYLYFRSGQQNLPLVKNACPFNLYECVPICYFTLYIYI